MTYHLLKSCLSPDITTFPGNTNAALPVKAQKSPHSIAFNGELSLELCAVIGHISPMALYRLVYAFGYQSLVTVLTRCGLLLPIYFLADEKHSGCLTDAATCPVEGAASLVRPLGRAYTATPLRAPRGATP